MGCLFWVPGVLHQCSEVVLWKLLSIQMIFDEFVRDKVVSLSYFPATLVIILFTFDGI